jgi:hypothetical protein
MQWSPNALELRRRDTYPHRLFKETEFESYLASDPVSPVASHNTLACQNIQVHIRDVLLEKDVGAHSESPVIRQIGDIHVWRKILEPGS